jgi:hypothetical protein
VTKGMNGLTTKTSSKTIIITKIEPKIKIKIIVQLIHLKPMRGIHIQCKKFNVSSL